MISGGALAVFLQPGENLSSAGGGRIGGEGGAFPGTNTEKVHTFLEFPQPHTAQENIRYLKSIRPLETDQIRRTTKYVCLLQ